MSADRLRLRVVTPDRVMVEAGADAVDVPAALGIVGILPGHAPLLSSLRTGVLEYRCDAVPHVLAVFGGFLEVRDNVVTVLADAAERPDEIDVDAARAAKAQAEESMQRVGGEALDVARRSLEAATTRLAVARQK